MQLSHWMQGAAVLVLGGGLASVALADCPQSLAPGVLVVFDDGTETLLRPGSAPGEVLEQSRFDGSGDGYDLRSYHGLFDIESTEMEDGRVIAEYSAKSDYPAGPPQAPVAGMQGVAVLVQVTTVDGRFERQITVSSGQLAPVDLAGCDYMALPVTLEWADPEEHSLTHHLYLPALGSAILLGYEDAEGRDDYQPRRIAVAPD